MLVSVPQSLRGINILNRAGKLCEIVDLRRRNFLLRFCQFAGAAFIPSGLWRSALAASSRFHAEEFSADRGFYLRPRYRSERPLDAVFAKVDPSRDRFPTEIYANQIAAILAEWSEGLRRSPHDTGIIAKSLTADFLGGSPEPLRSVVRRSDELLEIRQNGFSEKITLSRETFLRILQDSLKVFSKIDIAEFQITSVNEQADSSQSSREINTQIRYEIAGTVTGFHCEQHVGNWNLVWNRGNSGELHLSSWTFLGETQARARDRIYVDITAASFGGTSSYTHQLLHGSDYWRTILDGACGIDVYGHNGVSVADIDNDGSDDIYVCQPAGLPNRLYRNRGDGTFEDITEHSGLGILENTSCALFADFNNDGFQDVVLVLNSSPLLFLNDGSGKFRQQHDAFQFTNPPQGTFVGAAVADYDRDGWLDIYFCLYTYYQGTGQYRYPTPYHAAENGPPNFLMHNQHDGTFRDVTAQSGLNQNNTRYSFCCGWNDYNNDGWPDLYVVNDFGRKNLYRNNGNGTFTDVAAQLNAEDIGAGMSISWLDFNNDRSADIYVGNMWTAAGMRVSTQEIFKKESSPEIRALYQKHAMGNSLLENRGGKFEDITQSAGVGMGRWAWSSDAFDFDHDGFPDLYIANGMISGPSRTDLNSFFWRQVVANSPDEFGAAHDYEQAWNAINELVRSDATWSGYERNVFYANNRDGTFSDVSTVVGLNFVEDGRSFALADFDRDGKLEILLKNRNAPQIRLLKNAARLLPPSISFRLQGTKSNRDAIGAFVTIEIGSSRQVKSVQAGSGFLSQHSKDVFFGLGDVKEKVRASIRWPSGLVQELHDLPINHRIWVEEGSRPVRMEPLTPVEIHGSHDLQSEAEQLPESYETWLLSPVPAPDFSLPDQSGRTKTLSANRGRATFLLLSTSKSIECQSVLKALQSKYAEWNIKGLALIAINVDDFAIGPSSQASSTNLESTNSHFSFPVLRGSEDVAAIYNLLYRQLFDRHRDLRLPASFLIDADGQIVKVYQGVISPEHIVEDFQHIPRTDAKRLQRALPFPSSQNSLQFGRNYLSGGALFFQRGYLDLAEAWFQQALRDDPSSAEALYGIGSVYLTQNKNADAREVFERCVKLSASYPDTLPDAWNDLGILDTREGRIAESVGSFQQALQLNPNHLLSLNNLGNAYRALKRWDDARKVLERAVEIAPEDAEANYSLGMVYAQTDDTAKAHEYLQRALKARPDYPEALNNLGILYLVTRRRDEAVASFQQCIRVAPAFDQAYLNLARVYALEGARDKASGVLQDLLKEHPNHAQAEQLLQQLR